MDPSDMANTSARATSAGALARYDRRARVGAVVLLASAVVLFVGFFLPWVIRTPLGFAPGIPNALIPHGPLRPLDFLSVELFCFPLGLLMPIAGVAVAGIDTLLGGRRHLPLYLVVTAQMIGLILMLLLAGLMSLVLGIGLHAPPYDIEYASGFWLTLIGYILAIAGCLLVRRRKA